VDKVQGTQQQVFPSLSRFGVPEQSVVVDKFDPNQKTNKVPRPPANFQAKEQTVISAQPARDDLNNTIKQADQEIATQGKADILQKVDEEKDAQFQLDRKDVDIEGTYTSEEIAELGNEAFGNFNFDEDTGKWAPKSDEAGVSFDASIRSIKDAEREARSNARAMDEISRRDFTNGPMAQAIKQKYASLVEQQKEITRIAMQRDSAFNARFGTAQYAPTVATGLLSAEMRAGQREISRLAGEEALLIAQVAQSRREEAFDVLAVKFGELKELRQQKTERLQNQLKFISDREADLEVEREKQQTELSIVNLIGQGVEDPIDIFSQLNFDEEGKRTGNVSLEQISDTLDLIPGGGGVDTTGLPASSRLLLSFNPNASIDEVLAFERQFKGAGRAPASPTSGDRKSADLRALDQFVESNPNASDGEIKRWAQRNTELDVNEISSELGVRLSGPDIEFAAKGSVADFYDPKLLKGEVRELELAKEKAKQANVAGAVIKIDGKTITLTEEMARQLNEHIDQLGDDEQTAKDLKAEFNI
jgi:hypothetical protein